MMDSCCSRKVWLRRTQRNVHMSSFAPTPIISPPFPSPSSLFFLFPLLPTSLPFLLHIILFVRFRILLQILIPASLHLQPTYTLLRNPPISFINRLFLS